jgi:hypothetical protein
MGNVVKYGGYGYPLIIKHLAQIKTNSHKADIVLD